MTVFVGLYISRLEDEWLWGVGGLKSSDTLPFRVFADAISSSSFLVPTSLKVKLKLHTPCSSNGLEIIYIVLIAVLRCFAYH